MSIEQQIINQANYRNNMRRDNMFLVIFLACFIALFSFLYFNYFYVSRKFKPGQKWTITASKDPFDGRHRVTINAITNGYIQYYETIYIYPTYQDTVFFSRSAVEFDHLINNANKEQ